jgi:hypothetical protein
VRLKTRVFELYQSYYRNLSELTYAMGISVSEASCVRSGKRSINWKFFVGALAAFPELSFDDLFYLAPELPADNEPSPAGSASNMRLGINIQSGMHDGELIILRLP